MGNLNTSGITTETNGKTYPQFKSHGNVYDSLVGVGLRISQLVFENHITGESDGRVTEILTLMEDLETEAKNLGADNPVEAVRMALNTIRFINSHVPSHVLSLREELEIAVINTNERKRVGSIS